MGIQAHPPGGKSGFRLIPLELALTQSQVPVHGLPVPRGAIIGPNPAARRERQNIGWAVQLPNERVAFQPGLHSRGFCGGIVHQVTGRLFVPPSR